MLTLLPMQNNPLPTHLLAVCAKSLPLFMLYLERDHLTHQFTQHSKSMSSVIAQVGMTSPAFCYPLSPCPLPPVLNLPISRDRISVSHRDCIPPLQQSSPLPPTDPLNSLRYRSMSGNAVT